MGIKIEEMERRNRTIRIVFSTEDECVDMFWEMVDRGRTPKSNIKADDYEDPQQSLFD